METILTDDDRMQAVIDREAAFDGRFYYGVSTTGVYCRPSCPSRRPDPKNIRFFATPDDAEAGGFRECRRCRPRETALNVDAVLRVCRHIEANPDEPADLSMLASIAGLSPDHFQRVFKRLIGVSPREYAAQVRARGFKERLREGAPITEAAVDAGYSSTSRLYENAGEKLGMTPRAYRAGGSQMCIEFTIAPCDLGYLLVASTPRGICAVALGDSPADLEASLRAEFSSARIEASGTLPPAVDAILAHLDGRAPHLDLPVDVRATAFQELVWKALRRIPYGTTRTYEEVAESIGRPTAARAVARACATNPVALVVPCHRVVRKGGNLSGYRWGVARKKAILETERRAAGR